MQKTLLVKGRLVGPRSVELDEAVSDMTTEVEVLMRPMPGAHIDAFEKVSDFLSRLPAGMRSREEIDQQVNAERASWGDR